MPDRDRAPHEITRRDFIHGVNAGILALNAGTFTFGPGSGATRPGRTAAVRDVENIFIPMSDGVRLAARLWLPDDAEQNPVPAILEYLPYRKRDGTRLRDESMHPYTARAGYACVRVDIRGSGDSEGLPLDEYVKQEQDDALDVIAWLARQPWCTGSVGMYGKSWGGFNVLQVAARRPPALKAVISHCASDDRYTDDAHYRGGAVVDDMFVWGASFFGINGQPPDPEIVGDRWRDMWLDRLENMEFHLASWLRHPHRDEFWKHGSVNEDYSDIECPVYAVGGWVDCYSNAIPRLMAGLKGPRKGLIGPWGHVYPHRAGPGPRIDYLNEALRWWDYWLKDIDTGIMDEPALRVWMQHESACCGAEEVSGRWVAEESWPSGRTTSRRYYLNTAGLEPGPGDVQPIRLAPVQTVGQTAPRWCAFDMKADLPVDQRIDDARSMTFDSEPLPEDLEILGASVVTVDVAVDRPVALLAVRLNEVLPNGSSRRVTYGVLNLTHRDSHEEPTPLEPGERYRVRVRLDDIAHRFTRGNRLRIAISTAYWPQTWPSPEPVNLALYSGVSTLDLPVRPVRPEDERLHAFGEAFVPETSSTTVIDPGEPGGRTAIREMGGDVLTIRNESSLSKVRLDAIGTVLSQSASEERVIDDRDPTSAKLELREVSGWARGSWDARIQTIVRVELTKDEFRLTGEYRAYDHDELISTRNWDERIPRLLV